MTTWHINFFGLPHARCDRKEIKPQAREAWGVLASLLLPATLSSDSRVPFEPTACSRESLCQRFWGSKENASVGLRMALTFLRKTFGKEAIIADRETVRAASGWFVTDVEQVITAYQKSLAAESIEKRLQYLGAAEAKIRGELLKGCIQPLKPGERWTLNRQAEARVIAVCVLQELSERLIEDEKFHAALDITCRVLQFQPNHEPAQRRLWELANRTGQSFVAESLDGIDDYSQNLGSPPESQWTLSRKRHFESLLQAEMAQLPEAWRRLFRRIAVFPAPFTANLAREVCGISQVVLESLAETPLLVTQKGLYSLPELIRVHTWRQVPTVTRRKLERRLAAHCCDWLEHTINHTKELASASALFTDMAQAAPFLSLALASNLRQEPTAEHLQFLGHLHGANLPDLTGTAITYLERICVTTAYPARLRYSAGWIAGHILLAQSKFKAAIPFFESAIIASDNFPIKKADTAYLYFSLGNAYHYASSSEIAVENVRKARDMYAQPQDASGRSQCLRFLCEIQNHTEEFEEALAACEEALSIRQAADSRSNSVADALHWKAMTLYRLHRFDDSAQAIERALSIWQETGDLTGTAFCLRLMGRLHSQQKRYAEAKAHINHAILIHERTRDHGSLIAAIETLGDVFFQEGLFGEAEKHYARCLASGKETHPARKIQRFQAKVNDCQASVPI